MKQYIEVIYLKDTIDDPKKVIDYFNSFKSFVVIYKLCPFPEEELIEELGYIPKATLAIKTI